MHPDTRHKAIIALSFLIAVGWANIQPAQKPVELGIVVFVCAFALLYAAYYVLHILGWIAFDGEAGTGLRIIPRTWAGIAWVFRSLFGAIGAVCWWLWRGLEFVARAIRNAHERRKWEKGRPERERQAAEAVRAEAERQEIERQRIEEERQQQRLAEDEAHRLRVAREAEITAARTRAEQAAILEAQAEANRLAREHEANMLAIDQERLAIAERRGKRHEVLLTTLSGLVEKSKE